MVSPPRKKVALHHTEVLIQLPLCLDVIFLKFVIKLLKSF